VRRSISLLALPAIAVALFATSGTAAGSVFLGQVGKLGLSGTCSDCSVAQFADTGPVTGVPQSGSYKAPFGGVLTYFSYRAGEEITTSPADTVRPQVFSLAGSTALVNHEGAAHVVEPWPGAPPAGGGIRYFRDRVPIAAGEVMGGRFTVKNIAIGGDPTPQVFETTESGDKVGIGKPASSLGGSFTASAESKFRVNLLATLEPDADSDGYGDASQDLCLGSPVGAGACSGSLFGSALQKEVDFGGSCGLECLLLQKTIGGVSQAAPFDGVVVRWRMLDAKTGSYRVRTVSAPQAGEHYKMGPSSATQSIVSSAPVPLMEKAIASFPTRIPIEAGGYVGIVYQPSVVVNKAPVSTGSTYQQLVNSVPDGTLATGLLSPPAGELLYDADIEPDADHDGYGDVSQDSCPSAGTVHAGTCPPAAAGSSSAGTSSQETDAPPAITSFKAVPARFRVKRGGAVVSKKLAPAGMKLKLTLSKAAIVAFAVEEKALCKSAKGGKKCPPTFRVLHTFKRSLPQGSSSVPYSGRYRKGGKTRALGPAGFRVTAVPTDATGLAGPPKRTSFTIVR
jgi:hypothetical protein